MSTYIAFAGLGLVIAVMTGVVLYVEHRDEKQRKERDGE